MSDSGVPASSVPPVVPGRNDDFRQRYLALVSGRTRGPGPSLQRFGLYLASLAYGLAVRLRNLCYRLGWKRSHRVEVPVISVGNLTVGGTGKTPAVEYVAGFYRRHDYRVAILSRGYGSAGGLNDEALVLYQQLPDVPHLQGPDRVALARTAIEELESEILILDDGFQHRRLARNLDLVLIDVTNPWGYGYLLPRGLLREPASGLRRAQLVVLTRCDQVEPEALERLHARIRRQTPRLPVIETTHQPVELVNSEGVTAPLELLRERPIAAFCGLGHPEAFRRTLLDLGADVAAFRTFPDHHAYSRDDVEALHAWERGLAAEGRLVVTTQKDLVKLRLLALGRAPLWAPLWALRIRLQVRQGQDVLDRLLLDGVTM